MNYPPLYQVSWWQRGGQNFKNWHHVSWRCFHPCCWRRTWTGSVWGAALNIVVSAALRPSRRVCGGDQVTVESVTIHLWFLTGPWVLISVLNAAWCPRRHAVPPHHWRPAAPLFWPLSWLRGGSWKQSYSTAGSWQFQAWWGDGSTEKENSKEAGPSSSAFHYRSRAHTNDDNSV